MSYARRRGRRRAAATRQKERRRLVGAARLLPGGSDSGSAQGVVRGVDVHRGPDSGGGQVPAERGRVRAAAGSSAARVRATAGRRRRPSSRRCASGRRQRRCSLARKAPVVTSPRYRSAIVTDHAGLNDGLHTTAPNEPSAPVRVCRRASYRYRRRSSDPTNPTSRRWSFPGVGDALRRCYDGVGTRLS
jgi:hypothetical protein